MATTIILRNVHNIDEVEHMQSDRESTYIFVRDGSCEEVNFARQSEFNQVHLAVFKDSLADIKVIQQIELSPDEALLLRDWLNKEFPE
jgi:hypothetical protein